MQFDLLHCEGIEGIAQTDAAEVVEGTELLPLLALERKGMGTRKVNKRYLLVLGNHFVRFPAPPVSNLKRI